MHGGRHLDATPREIDPAAGHEIVSGGALRSEVLGEFEGRDNRGAVQAGEIKRVGDVIIVRVGAEHKVAGHGSGIDAAMRVFAQEGIEHQTRDPCTGGGVCGAGNLEEKAGMTVGGEAHGGARIEGMPGTWR